MSLPDEVLVQISQPTVEAQDGGDGLIGINFDVHRVTVSLGVRGPKGETGSAALRFDVLSPSASWLFVHGLGRVPGVQVFLVSGEQIIADVAASEVSVNITFASPVAGFAVVG